MLHNTAEHKSMSTHLNSEAIGQPQDNTLQKHDFRTTVNTLTNQRLEAFRKDLQQNTEFNQALNKYSQLKVEKAQREYDENPPWIPYFLDAGTVGYTFKVWHWTKDLFSDQPHDQTLNETNQFLINSIKTHASRFKPAANASVADHIAYELFAGQVSHEYLHDIDPTALDLTQLQARLATETATAWKVQEGIEMIKQNNRLLSTMHEQNKEFAQGQQNLHQLMEQVDRAAQQDHEMTQAIEKDLKDLGIKTNAQLSQILRENKAAREKLAFVCDHIKKEAEQKEREENIQGLMNAAGFVSELGRYVGSPDLYRIGTIAQAGVKIATSLMALQGPMSLASLTPMSAIAMSALSILLSFAKQGPNVNQMILDAIKSLSMKVDTLRQEMHARFDILENRLTAIYLQIIDGFCEMRFQNKTIIDILTGIENRLRDVQNEVRDYFSVLNGRLQNIEDMQYAQGRKIEIQRIYKMIQRAKSVHSLSAHDFVEGYNQFMADICELHARDDLFVGRKNLTTTEIVRLFESEESNPFASEFNLNALYECLASEFKEQRPTLVNPIIWSWQLNGFMRLLNRYYATTENAKRKISKPELMDLAKVVAVGKQTQQFSAQLRNPEIPMRLHDRHIAAGRELRRQLALYQDRDEKVSTVNLNQQLVRSIKYAEIMGDAKAIQINQNPSVFEKFQEQLIPNDFQAVGRWFTYDNYNNHPALKWCGGRSSEGKNIPGYGDKDIQQRIKSYCEARQNSIKQKNLQVRQQAQQKLAELKNQFHYFSLPTIMNRYPYAFMISRNPGDPILALPQHYQFFIPRIVQRAEWLGLGRVEFQYHREQIEEKNAEAKNQAPKKHENFIVNAVWVTESEQRILSTLTTPYDPSVYRYQKIVMINKKPEISEVAPDTIVMHRHDGNLTAYWKHNNQLHNKSMSEAEVKDISDRLPDVRWLIEAQLMGSAEVKNIASQLPDVGGSTDTQLIREITLKFGCTQKEKEALWWWWVGGNYCRDGNTYTETFNYPTSQQNVWEHVAYIPQCLEFPGKRDTIRLDNNVLKDAEVKTHLKKGSEFIKLLKQQIANKQKSMRKNFYDELKKVIETDTQSDLGKAFMLFSHTFYMLKSALTVAYGEDTLRRHPEFNYFFDNTVLSHRYLFLSSMETMSESTIPLTERLDNDLRSLEMHFARGLKDLLPAPGYHSPLDVVLMDWEDLMDWYTQHSVDHNELASQLDREEIQAQKLKAREELDDCLTEAVLNCDPESQRDLINNLKKVLAKKGKPLPSVLQGLLQYSRDDEAKSLSVSQNSPRERKADFGTDVPTAGLNQFSMWGSSPSLSERQYTLAAKLPNP